MSIALQDCTAGAARDMLLAAFVDAGLPLAVLEAAVGALRLGDVVRLEVTEVRRGGFRASHLAVRVRDDDPARAVRDISR